MTDMDMAQRELEDARREYEELTGLIEGLEQQVLDGNEAQAAKELGEKFGLQRLAELRQERAEQRVAAAEKAQRERALRDSREDATEALSAVSAEVLAEAYTVALAAVANLAALCRTRESAILEHSDALRARGDTELLVETGDSRRMIDVSGERFESGRCEENMMLGRLAGAVMAASSRSTYKPLFPRPNGLHPVERLVADAAGEDRQAQDVSWASAQFATRMVAYARSAAKNGEAA